MTKKVRRKILLSLFLILPVCVAVSCFLYPPDINYSSYLVPVINNNDPAYTLDEEMSSISYDIGNSSVSVRYMTDVELNGLFPTESSQGYYSINPYTYGNWIDPDIGYTPNRFTVFEVTVVNRAFAKMMIDPVEAVLMTDQGEYYHSYTTNIASSRYGNSFEDYYKSIRGQSGNEHYRYEMRLGMVRGRNYGLEELVFRGDSYTGLVTFDALRPRVNSARLILNDVVFRFDAFNRPSDTADVVMDFERRIDKEVITHEQKMAMLEKQKVRIEMSGTPQIVNNRINDSARNEFAVGRSVTDQESAMSDCFMQYYLNDDVDPGVMTVSFTVEADGTVSDQNVIEVAGINNEDFMNCILRVIQDVTMDPIEDMPAEGSNIIKGPAKPVNIVYALDFSVYMEE